jgi:hypothetical protein
MYDAYLVHGKMERLSYEDGYTGHYSDRMRQQDYEKYREACRLSSVTDMSIPSLSAASKFLSHYFGRTIKCVQVLEWLMSRMAILSSIFTGRSPRDLFSVLHGVR